MHHFFLGIAEMSISEKVKTERNIENPNIFILIRIYGYPIPIFNTERLVEEVRQVVLKFEVYAVFELHPNQ